MLAEAQSCACGAVPLRCPACEERRSATEESAGKLSMYTTVEKQPPRTLMEMNLPVAASTFKSRGTMGIEASAREEQKVG